MSKLTKYVLWFAQEHVNFRYAEISSLLKLLNLSCELPQTVHDPAAVQKPYCIVELPNENAARQLAARSVSIRCIFELWSYSTSLSTFHDNLKIYIKEHENDTDFASLFLKEKTFKVTVESYNKHFTQSEKVDKIESMSYLPVKGDANLKKPDVEWMYIEFYGLDANDVPALPFSILFGRWIADGNRSLIKDISLKTRKFIGNTSMDAQLSLLMANQVMAKKGDFVFDPFVGTGSLLVAAAKYGAYVAGTDIDYLMLHGRSRPTRINQKIREMDESVHANLKQYKCDNLYLDVLVNDFSLPIWTNSILFDGIITDPPYGIREAHEKIEYKERAILPKDDCPHYPCKSRNYNLTQLYTDLLQFSAKYLKIGGRLVCWMPVIRTDYVDDIIPQHDCLKLLANCEQELTSLTSRRLLTYEKIAEPANDSDTVSDENVEDISGFREKFFSNGEETRQERRIRRAESREIGRIEALKRGKQLDENGKVINSPKDN